MQIPAIAEKYGLEYKRVWRTVNKLGLPIERHRRGGRDYTVDEVRTIEDRLRDRKLIPSVHDEMQKLLAENDRVVELGLNSCGYFLRSGNGVLIMTKTREAYPIEPVGKVFIPDNSTFFV